MADDSKYPTRIAPYGLRMPPDLKERVQAAADKAGRSLHAELLQTLEEKYPPALSDLERVLADFMLSISTTSAYEVLDRLEKAKEEGGEKGARQFADFLDANKLTDSFMNKVVLPLEESSISDPEPHHTKPKHTDED